MTGERTAEGEGEAITMGHEAEGVLLAGEVRGGEGKERG